MNRARSYIPGRREAPENYRGSLDFKASGDHVKKVHDAIIRALRSGGSGGAEPSVVLRDVMCSSIFIEAVRSGTFKTPRERGDPTFAREAGTTDGKRAKLAEKLEMAGHDRGYLMPPLDQEELDFVYAALAGNPAAWEGCQEWPGSMDRPHDAFMNFIIRLAQEQRDETNPAAAATFMVNVLGFLAQQPTLTDAKEYSSARLVSEEWVGGVIHRKANAPVETAVCEFRLGVEEILVTPLDSICQKTGTAGLAETDMRGLKTEYDTSVAAYVQAHDTAESARQNLEAAKAASTQAGENANVARVALDAATDEHARAKQAEREAFQRLGVAKRQARATPWRGPAATGGTGATGAAPALSVIQAQYDEIKNAERAASQRLASARATHTSAARLAREAGTALREAQNVVTAAEALGNSTAQIAGDPRFRPLAMPLREAETHAAHFRDVLIQSREGSQDVAKDIAAAIGTTLENKGLKKLCKQAEKTAAAMEKAMPFSPDAGKILTADEKREVLAGVTSDVAAGAILAAREQEKEKKEKNADVLGREEEFQKQLAAFNEQITSTRMPSDMKAAFMGLAVAIGCKSTTAADVKAFTANAAAADARRFGNCTMQENIHPLKKAIGLAVEKMQDMPYDAQDLTPFEWALVRVAWERHEGMKDVRKLTQKSGWTRFKEGVTHLFTDDKAWRSRGRWTYNTAIGNTLYDIRHPRESAEEALANGHAKPRLRPHMRKDKDTGEYVPTRIPQVALAWPYAALKAYVTATIGSLLLPGNLSMGSTDYGGSFPWIHPHPILHIFRNPLKEFPGNLLVHFTPASPKAHFTGRIIDDTYDDPARLAHRPAEDHERHYGVGQHMLQGETTYSEAEKRLSWVAGKADVLRFFQERTGLKIVDGKVSAIDSKGYTNRVTTRNTPGGKIPRAADSLGLTTEEAIRDFDIPGYDKEATDNWQKGDPVSVEIRVPFTPIKDNLVLCTIMSDAFVQELMAIEKGGTKLTYDYLNRNMGTWTQKNYIVPKAVGDVIKRYGFGQMDNVDFVMRQGTKAHLMLMPFCDSGQAIWHIKPAYRDAFVGLMRSKITGIMNGIDPRIAEVPEEALNRALNETGKEAYKGGWLDNTKTAYDRNQLRIRYATLAFRNEATLDTLIAQKDMDSTLQKFFTPGTRYSIEKSMSDAFVQVLAQHKRGGGRLADFDPLTEPDAPMIGWALSKGYVTGQGSIMPTSMPAAPDSASQANAAMADAVLARAGNLDFGGFLDGILNALHGDKGKTGSIMQAALAMKYGGDRAAMGRAVKGRICAMLANPDIGASTAQSWGLKVTGQGAGLDIKIADYMKAGPGIRDKVLEIVQ